jgi:hypothetical protein
MGSNPPPPGGFNRCVFIEDRGEGGETDGMTSHSDDVMLSASCRVAIQEALNECKRNVR